MEPSLSHPPTPQDPAAQTPRPCGVAFWVCLLLFCVFSLSASQYQFGYEGASIDHIEALLRGELSPRIGGGLLPYSQAGPLEIAAYLPSAAVKLTLGHFGLWPGGQQLAYVFVIPLLTTLICAVFFAVAWTLFRNTHTAMALTLLLGLTTLFWPYAKFGMETHQTLWTLAGLWALILYDRQPTRAFALAFAVALAAMLLTKITGLVQAATLGLAAVITQGLMRRRLSRTSLEHLGLVVSIGLIGFALMLAFNRVRYGGWLWGGRYGFSAETDPYPFVEGIWAVLFSPGKSFFFYSPPVVIGLWYWGRFTRRFPLMKVLFPLMLLLALFHLHMRPWADETWGVRRLHFLVPIFVLPLGLWWERRARLGRWIKAAAWGVIALGFVIQLLAVSFDYTSQFFILGNRGTYSQEHTVWDPQFNPVRFNAHLLASACHFAQTGQTLPFEYERHYLPWWTPIDPPQPAVFEIDERFVNLDLWYLQQRRQWPNRPYWFVASSSYLVFVLILGALIATIRLRGYARPVSPGEPGA